MFDRYVQAQDRPAGQRGKQILVIASIAVHVVAIVGLIIYSFVHVEEVPPPLLTVTFFSASTPPPPPPPPPPPAGKKKTTPTKKPQTQPVKVQPLVQPKEPEKEEPEEEEEPDGKQGGMEGGQKGGVEGGTPGGTGTGPPPPPPPPPPPVKPKNIPPHELEQMILSRVEPHLPPAILSQHKGEQLRITVLFCIHQSGAPDMERTRILAGVPGTDDVIRGALKQWRCRPQALPVCGPIIFEINVE